MQPWREASTLILAARASAGRTSIKSGALGAANRTGGIKEDYKVLFLKRSPKSKFMPSRLVFPGGATHAIDWSNNWRPVFEKVYQKPYQDTVQNIENDKLSKKPPMILGNADRAAEHKGLSADVAFRICAIRETFEECGILLCVNKSDLSKKQTGSFPSNVPWKCSGKDLFPRDTLEKWRTDVQSTPEKFLEMCDSLDLAPSVQSLIQWRNWLTPVTEERLRVQLSGQTSKSGIKASEEKKKMVRRFDTMFYLCCVDYDELPHTSADNSETTTAQWYEPSELLQVIREGKVEGSNESPRGHQLAPPQVYELTHMKRYTDLGLLCDHAHNQLKSHLSAQCWMPEFRSTSEKGIVTVLPGDYMYPDNIDYVGAPVKDDDKEFLPLVLEPLIDSDMKNKKLNRIVYTDFSFQNGTVICNVV